MNCLRSHLQNVSESPEELIPNVNESLERFFTNVSESVKELFKNTTPALKICSLPWLHYNDRALIWK